MNRYSAWGLVSILLLLGGCASNDMQDVKKYVEDIKKTPPAPIDPMPEIQPIETFVYVEGNRRDPFRPRSENVAEVVKPSNNGIAPNLLRRKEELEQYSLDSLRMVGTLDQDKVMWGLIVNKDGTLFRVRAGNYMGQNHGQITRISEDKIDLTEIVPDGSGAGGWQERPATVALKQ
jgi:type IV pilus assembly protein PilP